MIASWSIIVLAEHVNWIFLSVTIADSVLSAWEGLFVVSATYALIAWVLMSIVPVVINVPRVWVWGTAMNVTVVEIVPTCARGRIAIGAMIVAIDFARTAAYVTFAHMIHSVTTVDCAVTVLQGLFVRTVIFVVIAPGFV